MKELIWLREEPKSPAFFFFFFFYHAFVVSRYKKLRAALAMEKTKPINQNKKTKETISSRPPRLLKVLGPKPFARRPLWDQKYIRKLQRKNYFSYLRSLAG